MEQDLTKGNLWKQILVFSLPLMISNLLQVLFNMADIAVVGRFAGSIALGAVGSTTTLVTLFTGFLIGMSGGVNVLIARYLGAKKPKDIEEATHTAVIICLLTGIVIMMAGLLFSYPILRLLHTKDELIAGATLYLRIYFLGMPALAVYNYGNAVFSAVGNTKKPLYYLTTAGIINIILNLFFVIVCHLDVAGVALASIISQYVSAILILSALFRSKEAYGLRLSKLRPNAKKASAILTVGFPSAVQYGIFQLANLFIQFGVNTFDATMVAGNSAAANADGLVYDVMAAFYTACSSFIGQNYGARNKDRVRKTYFITLAYSFGAGAVIGLTLELFGRQFLGLFTPEAAVIDAGMKRLVIMGFSYAFSAFMDNAIAASRGLGKSVVPTIIVIMGSCVFRIVWVYTIFAWFGTIPSLYLLYIFSWSITAIVEMIYFKSEYRRQVAVL
ncbi:MAG: MATE family efflux transporter [Lachnospiraceae bacterium]|nr:MATE family efflux transporter [Lachnospiraceae bacterium]